MKKSFILLLSLILLLGSLSCDRFLDIEPEGKIIPKTLEDFRAILTSGYTAYPRHKALTALRTDELVLHSETIDYLDFREIYIWQDVNQDPKTVQFPWIQFYNAIFYANHVIVDGQKHISASAEKDQLVGEAYALRAFAFFDLVNLYAPVYDLSTAATTAAIPLALEIDLEKVLAPESTARVYQQIHLDLEKAKALLQKEKQEKGINYRFSKAGVYALEARVYLYQKEWERAEKSAAQALAFQSELVDLNNSKQLPSAYDSPESIIALENTLYPSINNTATASELLLSVFDSEGDLRFARYFEENKGGYKFIKAGEQEQKVSFRTSELYFIAAESHARLGHLAAAKQAVKTVLKNRYTPAAFEILENKINNTSDTAFLDLLFEERFKEFAVEGHRWYDLRRHHPKSIEHRVDNKVYTLLANDPRYTLPYPTNARLNNPNL